MLLVKSILDKIIILRNNQKNEITKYFNKNKSRKNKSNIIEGEYILISIFKYYKNSFLCFLFYSFDLSINIVN